MPKDETFRNPLKYIDVTRATYTNLDVLQEKRIDDTGNADVDRTLSDSWTGFTKFTSLNEKSPIGNVWSERRFTKFQATNTAEYHLFLNNYSYGPFVLELI